MTNEEIQSVMNSTFGGLAIFCRDLELDESLISKYQPNQILMEIGFTDVTHKVGGLAKNCRYLVASSKGKDLSMFSQNPEFGHIVIPSGAFFKVLDIHKEKGKTQILLLNIPKEGIPIFANSKINIEDQVIEKGKEIFKRTISSKPLQELQSKDWIERTSFPIGMSQEGDFFLNADKKGTVQKESRTKNEQTKEVPLKEEKKQNTESIAESQTEIKAEKPKEKKKGFWNKLFGN
ncbi:hypothetical protein [Lewinella sp. LCG006]|uniref:hypothetical protein n=1 Tax=Lewinella sp. LCG006 TaxID=3231911 RepID=UPI003461471B